MIKAILFDKDGTLLEFSDIWIRASLKLVDELNLDVNTSSKLKKELGITKDLKVIENSILASGTIRELAASLDPYYDNDRLSDYIEEKFLSTIDDNKDQIRPTCDLKTLFALLKDRSIKIIVSTSDNLKIAKKMFEILGLEDDLTYIIAADHFPPKPSFESISFIMEKYDLKADEMLMLGDSRVDMEYGSKLKASVGVLCGTGSRQMLSKYADYIIDDPMGLVELLEKFD